MDYAGRELENNEQPDLISWLDSDQNALDDVWTLPVIASEPDLSLLDQLPDQLGIDEPDDRVTVEDLFNTYS